MVSHLRKCVGKEPEKEENTDITACFDLIWSAFGYSGKLFNHMCTDLDSFQSWGKLVEERNINLDLVWEAMRFIRCYCWEDAVHFNSICILSK